MRSIPISEFKAKCLRLVEEVRRTGEPIELTKRGKAVAVVNPPGKDAIDWKPGAFKDQIRILGDIECDVADLGVQWEALT
jgi:prevent-host-death family protein